MPQYKITNGQFVFYFNSPANTPILYKDWLNTSPKAIVCISILEELIDNGFATIEDERFCVIPVDSIYSLSETDRIGLNLPEIFPHKLFINNTGLLNQQSFSFECAFFDFIPHGNEIKTEVDHCIITANDNKWLLPETYYKILNRISEFKSSPNKRFEENLKMLTTLKDLSKESENVYFSSYLANEAVVMPSQLKIDLKGNKDQLEIMPVFDKEFDPAFQKNFDLFPKVKSVYPITTSGGKTRVLLDDSQQTQLQNIKKNRIVKDKEEIQRIIENPTSVFNPDEIDISVFYSDRVIEIGLYEPKFTPFVTPYKSQWLPGITLDFMSAGKKDICIKDQTELTDLKNGIDTAENNNLPDVTFKENKLSVATAKELYSFAEKQLQTEDPVDAFNGKTIQQKKVLIIQENTESLDYGTENPAKKETEVTHIFHPISNLTPGIQLKDHQKEGVAWLQSLYEEKFSGALLADDMGLGKTLQILYFLEWVIQNKNSTKPVLIVAPISLLENWQQEYERFFQSRSLPVLCLYGKNQYAKNGFDTNMVNDLSKQQLVLTNYETLRTYQLSICAVHFSLVILDEAQRIKTPGTLITSASKALMADFKIAMTGTPVENSLMDLWCIIDFAYPGLLGTARDFSKKYQSPLNHEDTDIVALGEQLRKELGIVIKRRLKADVAKDLPQKYISTQSDDRNLFDKCELIAEMPSIQLNKYKEAIEQARECESDSITMLRFIQLVKEISDHPFLTDKSLDEYSVPDLVESSAKLQALVRILRHIEDLKEKVIVFAERRETQRMIQRVVYELYGFMPHIINGDTPSSSTGSSKARQSRQQTISVFNEKEGFNVLVLSPIAAGVGLNITAANHVVHYSRHWNPAKEEQATDRAYRIGQQKDVYVYYPMAVSSEFESFDLILDKLLSRKLSLATHTLFPTEQAEIVSTELYDQLIK